MKNETANSAASIEDKTRGYNVLARHIRGLYERGSNTHAHRTNISIGLNVLVRTVRELLYSYRIRHRYQLSASFHRTLSI